MSILSKRQTQCLELVREGLTSKQIGKELGISPFTVDNHVRLAIERLCANGRTQAAARLQDLSHSDRPSSTGSQDKFIYCKIVDGKAFPSAVVVLDQPSKAISVSLIFENQY